MRLGLLLRLLEGLRGSEGGTEVIGGGEESALLSLVVLSLERDNVSSNQQESKQSWRTLSLL